MVNKRKLGKRIKKARQKCDLTGNQLADKISYTPDYIRKIESGASMPSLNCLIDICNVTDTSPVYLLANELQLTNPKYEKHEDLLQLLDKLNGKEQELVVAIVTDIIKNIENHLY